MKSDILTAAIIILALIWATYITVSKASEPREVKVHIMGPEFGPRPDCDELSGSEWQKCHGVERR